MAFCGQGCFLGLACNAAKVDEFACPSPTWMGQFFFQRLINDGISYAPLQHRTETGKGIYLEGSDCPPRHCYGFIYRCSPGIRCSACGSGQRNLPYASCSTLVNRLIRWSHDDSVCTVDVFTLIYGRLAAYNQRAEQILMPLLDVLQSVPILSFLPVVLLGLSAILPEGLASELASIILIFTSQVWNLTFAWYQSLTTIPKELREASSIFRLNTWFRFKTMELPFAAISMVR